MSILNMLLILMAWILCLLQFVNNPDQRIRWFCWLYIVQIYLMREADFHRAFTEEHVTKIAFYTADFIPLWQKLTAGSIMLGFIAVSFYTLISNARRFWQSLVAREPWAISLLLVFVFLPCSQIFDKTVFNEHPSWKVRSVEEMLEVTSAFYAVAAISLYSTRHWSASK